MQVPKVGASVSDSECARYFPLSLRTELSIRPEQNKTSFGPLSTILNLNRKTGHKGHQPLEIRSSKEQGIAKSQSIDRLKTEIDLRMFGQAA